MMAKLGTHPLDVAKKRFQVSVALSHMHSSRQAAILCIVDL